MQPNGHKWAWLDTPIVEIFEPVAQFTSILATHEIGAAKDIENCQIVLDMLKNADERMNPTKYGHAATHSSHELFQLGVIPYDPA